MKALTSLLLGISAALLLVVSAASAGAQERTLKGGQRPIAAVALDGGNVIYATDDNAVRVWNIRTGAVTQLRHGAGHYQELPEVTEVALAGSRATWITLSVVGNSRETTTRIFTGSLAAGATHKIGAAFRVDGYSDNGVELWTGGWIGGLTGSGHVLAVSRWTTTPKPDQSGNVISNARLDLIGPQRGRLHVIATGEQSIVSAAVDRGRIAVLRPDQSVGIYSSTGALLKEITPSSAQEIAYGGGRVVVLTNTKTLEVYDAATGSLLHSWPVHTAARLKAENLSAYGRIGLYLEPSGHATQRLHLVDLATGREHVLPASANVRGSRDAVVGPLGLVYALNRYHYDPPHPAKATGTLVYLRTASVLAMLRR